MTEPEEPSPSELIRRGYEQSTAGQERDLRKRARSAGPPNARVQRYLEIRRDDPEAYRRLPPAAKLEVGYWESAQQAAEKLEGKP